MSEPRAPGRTITEEEAERLVAEGGWRGWWRRRVHKLAGHERIPGYFDWGITQHHGRLERDLRACAFCGANTTHPHHGRWYDPRLLYGASQSAARRVGDEGRDVDPSP